MLIVLNFHDILITSQIDFALTHNVACLAEKDQIPI